MQKFTKAYLVALMGTMVTLPVVAGLRGWGISSERDARIIRDTEKYCPASNRDAYGRCRRSHRSYFNRRSPNGGGIRGGK